MALGGGARAVQLITVCNRNRKLEHFTILSFSETQKHIVGARETPNGRKNFGAEKLMGNIIPPPPPPLVLTFSHPHYLPMGLSRMDIGLMLNQPLNVFISEFGLKAR